MKKKEIVNLLNGQASIDPPWSMLDLVGVKAVGFNSLGGGIGNMGVFLFDSEEKARRFINDAPISRSLVWLDGE